MKYRAADVARLFPAGTVVYYRETYSQRPDDPGDYLLRLTADKQWIDPGRCSHHGAIHTLNPNTEVMVIHTPKV